MTALSDDELGSVTGGKQENVYRRYKLQEGETLADVAVRFGTTEIELIRINKFRDAQLKKLRRGDIIMIPVNV